MKNTRLLFLLYLHRNDNHLKTEGYEKRRRFTVQVTRVTDVVNGPYYKNAMHFMDGADEKIEYEYNKNGAMTKDLNKGIEQIEYNHLNLPTKLVSAVSSFCGGSSNAKYIDSRRDYQGNVRVSVTADLLGNDGINDRKVYVIKTTKSSFEDESFGNAPVAGITKKEAKAAKAEIAANSGDASHDFSQARNSFVELDGSQEIRQEVLSKIEDDGSGGTKESNNREYGMNYERNEPLSVYSQKGAPGVPGEGTEVSVFSGDQPQLVYYHTHPSGTNGMYKWGQAPSYKDVDNKTDTETNSYVVGMRNNMVYIYNKSGIISTFPLSIFTK